MFLLSSSDIKSICYVETKNLDGETNLKTKYVQKNIKGMFQNDASFNKLSGEINCEKPNNSIHTFEGMLSINGERHSLNNDNLLLRGMSIRNTEYIIGITVFQGHDTKVFQNNAKAKYKFSQLEILTNFSILVVFLLQILFAGIGAFFGANWSTRKDNLLRTLEKGLDTNDNQAETYLVVLILKCGTWILIFTNFVPISLMVTFELVKFWQALFMQNDVLMFDEEQDMEMRAQSSNLNEELGQVEYVFSDKTGTLTCNVMEFKKFSAGTKSYGTGKKPTEAQESNVSFSDPALMQDLRANNEELIRVLLFLGACHTIIIDEKKGTYNAASPDELALVNAAKQFGFVFEGIDINECMIVNDRNSGVRHKYKLLNVCEFTSTRKRMSVIMRDPNGKVLLMCKGADSVILERLSNESLKSNVVRKTQKYVDEYAQEGLRTLFLAEKEIPENIYQQWNKESQEAKLVIDNREAKVAAVDEKIEVDMELIGSTAIEDRLQDKVADTIQFMKNAGIKVWVLTGDKIETAMNIGVSAGLLDSTMSQYIIDEVDEKSLHKKLELVQNDISG